MNDDRLEDYISYRIQRAKDTLAEVEVLLFPLSKEFVKKIEELLNQSE